MARRLRRGLEKCQISGFGVLWGLHGGSYARAAAARVASFKYPHVLTNHHTHQAAARTGTALPVLPKAHVAFSFDTTGRELSVALDFWRLTARVLQQLYRETIPRNPFPGRVNTRATPKPPPPGRVKTRATPRAGLRVRVGRAKSAGRGRGGPGGGQAPWPRSREMPNFWVRRIVGFVRRMPGAGRPGPGCFLGVPTCPHKPPHRPGRRAPGNYIACAS